MIRRQFARRIFGAAFFGSAGAYMARAEEPVQSETTPESQARPEVEARTEAEPKPEAKDDMAAPAASPGRAVTVSMYSKHQDGARTASGERFSSQELTTAHKALPFGTLVRLTNPLNQQSVVVRVNDRGPFVRGRELDISLRAARELGLATAAGLARLIMHVITEAE